MKTEWNLEVLYKGLDDPAYEADMKRFEEVVDEYVAQVEAAKNAKAEDVIESLILKHEELAELAYKLQNYLGLRQSVETENGDLMAQMNRLMRTYNKGYGAEIAHEKISVQIADVDELSKSSEVVAAYNFSIKESKKRAQYLFNDEVEAMISAMNMTGGSAHFVDSPRTEMSRCRGILLAALCVRL